MRGLLLTHRFVDFVAKEIPYFLHAAAEIGISHALEITRTRHVHWHDALDDGRRCAQDCDPVAEHDGLFHITVVVTTDVGNVSSGRVISVPVVVGNPTNEQKLRGKPAPSVDAAGERVKSLPASERVR